jgi:copper transport protein
VVGTAPAAVELTFDEPVQPVPGGVRVLDASGEFVARGEASVSADGRTVTQPVDLGDGRGTSTVSYRVVSEDGHVVAGSWVFSVGERTAPAGVVEQEDRASRFVEFVGRSLASVGAFLALGVVVVAGLEAAVPLGTSLSRRRSVLVGGAVCLASGTLLVLVGAAGLYAGSLGGAPTAWWDVVRATSSGSVLLVRLVLAGALLAVALVGTVVRRLPAAVVVVAAAATVAPAFGGHAVSSSVPVLASAILAAHLLAGAVWLGALGVLALRWSEDRDLLGEYSTVAFVAAPVVVLSGLAGAWIQLGGLGPLGNSTYGRLLLLKLLLASVVLVLGWTNRRTLARVTTAALDLAASVRVEALLGLVVLAVSAVLVVTPPPSDEPVPVAVDATSGQLVVRAVVTPGVAGPNRVELRYLDTTGTPVAVDATDLRVSSVGVEPRRVEVRAVEPSVAVAEEVVLTPGPWRLEVTAVTRGEPTRFTLEVQLP